VGVTGLRGWTAGMALASLAGSRCLAICGVAWKIFFSS
jgi:hypothetical protein